MLAHESIERFASDLLDYPAKHVEGQAIAPARARLRLQGSLSEAAHILAEPQVWSRQAIIDPEPLVSFDDPGHVHEAVGQARCMPEQVADRWRPQLGHGVAGLGLDLKRLELGYEAFDGIIEADA